MGMTFKAERMEGNMWGERRREKNNEEDLQKRRIYILIKRRSRLLI
jgi:hypothetical protein